MTQESQNDREAREAIDRAALAVNWKYGRAHRIIIRLVDVLVGPLIRAFQNEPLPDLNQVEKILVLEQGHLGDVIHLTPFLQNLRRRFPNAHIAVLGRPGLRTLLEVQNLSDELIPIYLPWTQYLSRWRAYNPFSLRFAKFIRDLLRLRRRKFDLAFVAGLGDIRPNFALFLTGARRRVAYGFAGGRVFLTDVAKPDLSRMHRPDLPLRLLEQIGIPVTTEKVFLTLSHEDAKFGYQFLAEKGISESDSIVGIHAGAGFDIKEWGKDRFEALAERIVTQFGAKVLWFSNPGQASAQFIGENRNIINVSVPLRQFLAVLSRCHAFVGNDSGPMHMAAGLGVRVVAIFGPELPEWFGPLGEGHQIVIRKGMWCRPCWRKCKFEERYCLRLISVEEVLHAVGVVMADWAPEKNVVGARS